jgi:NAD(P)-dependent dehydrogenase (short-subunit alcohol dehydrogenase family)
MSRDDGTPIAVVTGGTGALGREVVKAMVLRGFRVHVPWRSEASAADLHAFLGEATDGLVLERADLGDPTEVERFFAPVAEGGRLDALCNLAGGFAAGAVEETSPSTWLRMFETNATSAFLSTRAAIPVMRRGGGGAIVNVGAVPALEGGGAGMSAYAAAKASVVALTKAWAKELKADGIRVNAVAPEIIDTPSNRTAMSGADRSTWLQPSEIASVIAFLASAQARIVTGSVLTLRG